MSDSPETRPPAAGVAVGSGPAAVGLAFAAGLGIALSFPIHPVRPLAWVALAPLVVVLEGRGDRERFLLGWACGLGCFTVGLHWLVGTMHVYGGLPLVVGILGEVLFSAGYLALYPALFGLLAPCFGLGRARGVLGLAALWTALELLRSVLFTGFPWLSLGYSQMGFLNLVQVLDVTGIYGLSFLLVASSVAVARLARAGLRGSPPPWRAAAAVALAAAVVLAYGVRRTAELGALLERSSAAVDADAVAPGPARLRVAALQGNIPQDLKWDDAFKQGTVEVYEHLTDTAAAERPALVVLPETAMPFWLQERTPLRTRALGLAARAGAPVVLGSPAVRRGDEPESLEVVNRAWLIDPEGFVLDHYDKLHLVPFGEFSPVPFLDKLVAGVGNFHPGLERRVFQVPGVGAVGVLICYEAIFPMEARATVTLGADLLVNVTNDAWFGHLGAPVQHLEMAQARAIENRVAMVRAANTGISAAIDPLGRIEARTALFEEAALVASVPVGVLAPSPWARHGDLFARVVALVVVARLGWLGAAGVRRRRAMAAGASSVAEGAASGPDAPH